MADRQRNRARDVDIAFIIGDLISAAVAKRRRPSWLHQDGRKCNQGVANRRCRSYAFKIKVIEDYERYNKQLPDYRHHVASVVADLHDITKDQVNVWVKRKASIYEHGGTDRRDKRRHLTRMRHKKGMFAVEEEIVFNKFQELRKQGRQIGPKYLRSLMRREVNKIAQDDSLPYQRRMMAKTFRGGTSWLFRFAKRWKVTLRRKTNVKKVPIQERAKKIKRWMALFRIWLSSFQELEGYNEATSIFPAACRWSLDQVPAGLYDPKSTYEHIGAERVHIASNGAADSHRFCTLQICIRNKIDEALPRFGQPRLCICFRGTGQRVSDEEKKAYHPDVVVMWQRKAWYDAATCNKWIAEYALHEIRKADLVAGQRHLILCDNLAGQTKRSNPTFSKLLHQHCACDVFNLLAGDSCCCCCCRYCSVMLLWTGCTDEIQVVDAGFGALVKRHTEDVQMEWIQNDDNFTEWTGKNLSASRKRVLSTLWYGEGYERACCRSLP